MRQNFSLTLVLFALVLLAAPVHAADLKIEARLIWAANEQPETMKFESVDPELADKLHRTFKWKNYYEITNKTASIPVHHSADLRMSDSCTIRIRNMGASRLEVSCIGKGKQVHKGDYTLKPPQWLVLGGNATDNTAWFIGLREIDGKKALTRN